MGDNRTVVPVIVGILILGLIGYSQEAESHVAFTMLGPLAYGQVPVQDEATLIIYSNINWSGDYGREGSSSSASGHGDETIKFSCFQNSSYEINFSKGIDNGYLIINLIQNRELLNFAITEADDGQVSMSGKCYTPQVPSNNNGFIAITTDKSDYLYGDTIRVIGSAKFISNQDALQFKILNPDNIAVWSESLQISWDNEFAMFPLIRGNVWKTDGQYTLIVYYDEVHKLNHKINITQEKVSPSEPQTQIDPPSLELDAGPSEQSTQKIPDWVKNTMGWYADGLISEDEIISAIKFLIKEGIIRLD